MDSDAEPTPTFDPPTHHLSFPSVSVNDTLADIASQTLDMRSNTRKPAEEAPSSLEDSAYEVLGESSFGISDLSDDEGRTESLASTDGQTPDDISVAGTEDGSDDGYTYNQTGGFRQHVAESTRLPYDDRSRNDLENSSMMTSRAESNETASKFMEMHETQSPKPESLDGCRVIRTFESPEMPDVLQPYVSPEVRITVRMALSKRSLTLDRHFRIMYVGHTWEKKDICEQIAAALTASSISSMDSSRSSSASRFSIVQVPPFSERTSSTKVQLIESSRHQLLVDQCTDAVRLASGAIQLTRDDKTQMLFEPSERVQVFGESCSPHLPDLAVFCHDNGHLHSDSTAQLEQFELVRAALSSRSIPILNITTVRPFHQCPETFTFASETLRLCVEGRNDAGSKYAVLETLPIDIFTFCELSPAQLNRHLAYIMGSQADNDEDSVYIHSDRTASDQDERSENSKAAWTKRSMLALIRKQWLGAVDAVSRIPMQQIFWVLATLVIVPILVLSNITYSPSIGGTLHRNVDQGSKSFTRACHLHYPTPVPSVIASTPPLASSVALSSKDLTVASPETSLGHPLQPEKSRKTKGSEDFRIQVIGDHQFAIAVPSHLTKMKKRPQVYVQVIRGHEIIPSRISSWNETAYAVALEQDHKFGPFNVTIWTKTKPLLSKTVTVELGARWPSLLTLAGRVQKISKSFQKEVILAHEGLKDISTHVINGVSEGVDWVEDGTVAALEQTKQWGNQARQASQSIAEHLQDASREATQQLSIGYRVTRDMSTIMHRNLDAWAVRASEMARSVSLPNIWQQTASVRTSKTILDARKNARNIFRKAGHQRSDFDVDETPLMDRKTRKRTAKKLRRARQKQRGTQG